jgi:hypothetical protein
MHYFNPFAAGEGPRPPPEPSLEAHPMQERRELRKADRLDHYAWGDKHAGVVRIPMASIIEARAPRASHVGTDK